jgi:hypothetical protein
MKAISTAVPFIHHGNKLMLTRNQLCDDPGLADFVERFRNCFRHDVYLDVLYYEPPDEWRTGEI